MSLADSNGVTVTKGCLIQAKMAIDGRFGGGGDSLFIPEKGVCMILEFTPDVEDDQWHQDMWSLKLLIPDETLASIGLGHIAFQTCFTIVG